MLIERRDDDGMPALSQDVYGLLYSRPDTYDGAFLLLRLLHVYLLQEAT